MNAISQSLAGRTALLKLLPFSIEELRGHLPQLRIDTLSFTGFYPRIHDRMLQPARAVGDYSGILQVRTRNRPSSNDIGGVICPFVKDGYC